MTLRDWLSPAGLVEAMLTVYAGVWWLYETRIRGGYGRR